MSDGVSHPCWIRVLRQRAAIGPDLAVDVSPFEVLKHALRRLDEFHGINRNFQKQIPRHSDWIARHHGVVSKPASYGAWSVDGLRSVESCFTPRSHWRRFVAHR